MFWSWLRDTDELVVITREKAIRPKKWGVTFEDDLLCHLSLPMAIFLVRQKIISLRHGGWVVFTSELSLNYIIIDFISVSQRGAGWSTHSSAGAGAKTGNQAEWNQIACTGFNRWNHRGREPPRFEVSMWAVKGARASAFFNLLSASHASIIVLPALGRAVQHRREGWSTQNMTLSLLSSCSLLPSIEGAGDEIEMKCNGAVAGLALKKRPSNKSQWQ